MHGCALEADTGLPVCWGDGSLGQISQTPNRALRTLSVGGYHACGLTKDTGDLICWGHNNHGQSDVPEGEYVSVEVGNIHTCGLLDVPQTEDNGV